MTEQLGLDYESFSHARTSDPVTSKEAAVRAKRFATTHSEIVLATLRTHGGMTPHEIASFVHLDSVQITRRLNDLQREGRALPTDQTRRTPSGSRARVWAAT